MTRIPTTPEVYAAFRAECLKADIEMDSVAHIRNTTIGEKERNARYQMTYRNKHRDELLARQQRKTALRLQSENGANKNILTTL